MISLLTTFTSFQKQRSFYSSFKQQIYDIVLVPEDAFCIIKVEYLLSDTKYNLMTTPIRKCWTKGQTCGCKGLKLGLTKWHFGTVTSDGFVYQKAPWLWIETNGKETFLLLMLLLLLLLLLRSSLFSSMLKQKELEFMSYCAAILKISNSFWFSSLLYRQHLVVFCVFFECVEFRKDFQ